MRQYSRTTQEELSCIERATRDESGFSIAEFLISSVILLLVSSAVFTMLAQIQRASSYQTEVQAVLENTRIGMDTVERLIRQAGNDPKVAGFAGVTITSATEVRILSDLTGSLSGAGSPDKGDPDGDTLDAGEDVTIRYDATNRCIELVPNGGAAQPIANYITAFQMQYLNAAGAATTVGADVRRIRITMTGGSNLPDPQTGQVFSVQVASDVQLATRQ